MKIKHIFFTLVALLSLSACTQNGGDIGIWWGTWNIESVSVNGTNLETYKGDFFVQFQGEIVRMSQQDENYTPFIESYGNWSEGDGTMTWLFTDGKYPPLTLPGLTKTNKMTIESKSSNKVVLVLTTEAGVTYRYGLKKVI